MTKDEKELPPGYEIVDGQVTPHDGDEEDGRYGLYLGSYEDGDFLGNLDDKADVIRLAWEHSREVGMG